MAKAKTPKAEPTHVEAVRADTGEMMRMFRHALDDRYVEVPTKKLAKELRETGRAKRKVWAMGKQREAKERAREAAEA